MDYAGFTGDPSPRAVSSVVQVGIGSCAILGWNIETCWVTFARCLVLSMLRVSVCGLPCQWLVRFFWGEYGGSWVTFAWRMSLSMVRDSVRGLPCQIVSCASLGENSVAVGLRSLAFCALIVEVSVCGLSRRTAAVVMQIC